MLASGLLCWLPPPTDDDALEAQVAAIRVAELINKLFARKD